MVKVLILTSSRADFGIYLPLLKKLRSNKNFQMEIMAFGTHLSKFHGYTVDQIEETGFEVKHKVNTVVAGDSPADIATSYALTAVKFASFWQTHAQEFDWALVLGDRYEMAAAVAAGIPFNIRFAHIHGGETTLGAIDNIYRHSITLASKVHFVSADRFKDRIAELTGQESGSCYVTGALGLDNIADIKFLSIQQFQEKWAVDLSLPTILATVHPETIDFEKNEKHAAQLCLAFAKLTEKRQIIITMPNADTGGTMYRTAFSDLKKRFPEKVVLIENFGTQSYFTCMKHAGLLIGNTSSGIIEAASFGKYVLDLGKRQQGRLVGENVLHLSFDSKTIVETAQNYFGRGFKGENLYYKGGAAEIIMEKLQGK